MSTRPNTSVSKPLLIILLVVVLLGIAYFVYSKTQAGGADENNIPGVLEPPADYKPLTPEDVKRIGGPTPSSGGGG